MASTKFTAVVSICCVFVFFLYQKYFRYVAGEINEHGYEPSSDQSEFSCFCLARFFFVLIPKYVCIVFVCIFRLEQPPIKVFGIEGRYATALFLAGSKQNQLDAIEKDLTKFQVSNQCF